MIKIRYFLLVITLFILTGCASNEYYRDQAADSAREFIFEKFPHISPENKTYICCTYPDILYSPILSSSGIGQFCFAWTLKEPDITLLVYGAGKNNLENWYPVKLIFKKYSKEELASMKDVEVPDLEIRGEATDQDVPERTN